METMKNLPIQKDETVPQFNFVENAKIKGNKYIDLKAYWGQPFSKTPLIYYLM